MSPKTKTVLLSLAYTGIAGVAGAAVHSLAPAAYAPMISAALAALLLNLRNAWHLPADAG